MIENIMSLALSMGSTLSGAAGSHAILSRGAWDARAPSNLTQCARTVSISSCRVLKSTEKVFDHLPLAPLLPDPTLIGLRQLCVALRVRENDHYATWWAEKCSATAYPSCRREQ